MNIKQTMRNLVLGGLLLVPLVAIATVPVTVSADPDTSAELRGKTETPTNNSSTGCRGVETAIIKCEESTSTDPIEQTGVWAILLIAVNIMTAGVGVLALAGFIYGAILYTSAGGSSEQVKKARTVFTNVVIGVIAFGGMYALLNFIVPGGVFAR